MAKLLVEALLDGFVGVVDVILGGVAKLLVLQLGCIALAISSASPAPLIIWVILPFMAVIFVVAVKHLDPLSWRLWLRGQTGRCDLRCTAFATSSAPLATCVDVIFVVMTKHAMYGQGDLRCGGRAPGARVLFAGNLVNPGRCDLRCGDRAS